MCIKKRKMSWHIFNRPCNRQCSVAKFNSVPKGGWILKTWKGPRHFISFYCLLVLQIFSFSWGHDFKGLYNLLLHHISLSVTRQAKIFNKSSVSAFSNLEFKLWNTFQNVSLLDAFHATPCQCWLEKCWFWAMKQLAPFRSVSFQAFIVVKFRVARSKRPKEKCWF